MSGPVRTSSRSAIWTDNRAEQTDERSKMNLISAQILELIQVLPKFNSYKKQLNKKDISSYFSKTTADGLSISASAGMFSAWPRNASLHCNKKAHFERRGLDPDSALQQFAQSAITVVGRRIRPFPRQDACRPSQREASSNPHFSVRTRPGR